MANPHPTCGHETRIKKGEKRNPTGKRGVPLKKILVDQAEDLIRTKGGDAMCLAEAICLVAWNLALKGNLDAIKFIFDRLEGKVPDKVPMSGEAGGPLVIEHVNDWRSDCVG